MEAGGDEKLLIIFYLAYRNNLNEAGSHTKKLLKMKNSGIDSSLQVCWTIGNTQWRPNSQHGQSTISKFNVINKVNRMNIVIRFRYIFNM